MTVPGQVASYIEAQELYTTNYLQLFAFNYYGIKEPIRSETPCTYQNSSELYSLATTQ